MRQQHGHFRDLLKQTKAEIREVDTATADEPRTAPGTVVLDVREPDEYEQGAIPGAVHIPRGHLESHIEGRVPDRHAARRLLRRRRPLRVRGQDARRARLHRRRVGGRRLQQVEGRGPRLEGAARAQPRAAQPLPAPPPAARGRRARASSSCSTPRCCCSAPAGSARRPRSTSRPPVSARIGIVDMDVVDDSNLQRQILHNIDRIGDRKVDSAKKTLTALNPDVNVVTYDTRLDADNVIDDHRRLRRHRRRRRQLPEPLPAQRRVGEARHPRRARLDLPLRGHGHACSTRAAGPTYRDMVPEPPPAELAPSCAEAGVLGVLPGIIGSIQALEAIKLILDLGDPLIGRLLAYDSLEQDFRTFKVQRRPGQRGHLGEPRPHRGGRARRAVHAPPAPGPGHPGRRRSVGTRFG